MDLTIEEAAKEVSNAEMIEKALRSSMNSIEIPVNIVKDKVEFCLPPFTQIEDEAVVAINKSLNRFLECFAKKIRYDNNKIMVKNIKNTIETESVFSFLRKLTEK